MGGVCLRKVFFIFFQNISLASEKELILNNVSLLQKWERSADRGKVFYALQTDISKAFDCLNHDLLTAILNAYGSSLPALRLFDDYLLNREQRTKTNNS